MEYLSKEESQKVRVKMNRKRNYYGNNNIASMIELYVNGETQIEISRKVKVSQNAISQILSKHWFYQKIDEPVVLTFESNVQPLTPKNHH